MGAPAITTATTTVHECHATRLQSIKPMTMLPERYTERSQALTMLKRIESLEVTESFKRNGHRYYAIDIYFKISQSHIPTVVEANFTAKTAGVPGRRPDARFERRLSELGNMRDEMYYFAHTGHGRMPCRFCSAIVDYVLHGSAKPRTILRWLDRQEEIHATMTQFLNDILFLTTKVKVYGGHECQGQDNIPILLRQFLFPGLQEIVETAG